MAKLSAIEIPEPEDEAISWTRRIKTTSSHCLVLWPGCSFRQGS